jgi:hypothetical protein
LGGSASRYVSFLGCPRLRRVLGQQAFCEAEQTLFASFSGKRRISLDELTGMMVGGLFKPRQMVFFF